MKKFLLILLPIVLLHACSSEESSSYMAEYRGIAESPAQSSEKENKTYDDHVKTSCPNNHWKLTLKSAL